MAKFGFAFDLEGTIIDVERAHHQAHIKVARELGVELSIGEALKQILHFIGGPDEKIMEEIMFLSKCKNVSIEELMQKDEIYYKEFLKKEKIQIRSGFIECLTEIKKNNYEVAIGTLTDKDEAWHLINNSGLNNLIITTNIVYRDDVSVVKPAPAVFLETAKRMKVSVDFQIVFEDSPRGVTAAINSGSRMVIGMPIYGLKEVRDLLIEAGAKYVFGDWKEVKIRDIVDELNKSI
ncbi:MAG: HAD family phosphatase [Candidatus Magasanikbacteria bacterium]